MVRKIVRKCVMGLVAILILGFVGLVTVAALRNDRVGCETDLSKSALMTQTIQPLARAITLKVATFNIHDLYVASAHRMQRMRAIAENLLQLDPDLVGIQESFIEKDRNALLAGLRGGRLLHHQYYPSATVGCGLLVLSAFPIVENFLYRYNADGKWYKFYHGDWWAGKGVALARIALPGGGYLDFYNTHAHAQYGSREYAATHRAQMGELAAFVKRSALSIVPALLVGDINCRPDSESYRIATAGCGLERMMTVDSRLDHIFSVANPRYRFKTLETREIRGQVPVPGGHSPLSDHPGYLSVIAIEPAG